MTDTKLTNLEQAAKANAEQAYPLPDEKMDKFMVYTLRKARQDGFIAGASHDSQSVPGDIVERLENSHPFDTGLGVELRLYEIWMECCTKLRELLSQSYIKDKNQ